MKEVTKQVLEAALGRARELEKLGTFMAEEEESRGRNEAYELYGVRAFPVADAIARYDLPLLVEEIKRLRGWV